MSVILTPLSKSKLPKNTNGKFGLTPNIYNNQIWGVTPTPNVCENQE